MKKIIFLVVSILLLAGIIQKASAQYYFYDNNTYDAPVVFELGASFGMMNCFTDLGGAKGLGKKGTKDLNLGNNHFNGSIYLMATYKEAVSLRLEGTFGQVSAYDSILKPVSITTNGRYERNLSFRSKISEVSLIAEFHPLFIFINWMSKESDPPRFSPYIAAGVGLFNFNPQTKNRNGQYVDLQPLSTEGQGFPEYPNRKPYKLTQINFPIGAGVRYELSPTFNVRAEFLYRILNTDYLDDVSTKYINPAAFDNNFVIGSQQWRDAKDLYYNDRVNLDPAMFRKSEGGIRGNSKNKDAYFTFNLKIGLTFGRQKIN